MKDTKDYGKLFLLLSLLSLIFANIAHWFFQGALAIGIPLSLLLSLISLIIYTMKIFKQ
ncbi:hypothetical protein Dtox_2762 [Desulfofarcimen acetoxidans DSM 771]|uniref:Uncharacterized protein n=1 Tax=Desulfofarcimen acetoxidans (strain ATCC 49208 / DSM 771 / KCTC 5769 / VKM B-1644 / 5575) TaxID=485916 RepID=C8W1R4_DESAS|nr:hypothetical protein [Desulfofarcimen acetoxidans]ACV63535.1 hypothetical protein Dtox_2762 [Desulfofarcimen acetoxidans DSM 771]